MWYRSAQLYDVHGKNLLEFGPFVMPPQGKQVAFTGVPKEFQSVINRAQNQWSSATWNPQYGLQFWTSNGKLIGSQQPNSSVFQTLRGFEPYRFKSDFTDKIILDLYRRGKSIEQAVQQARSQNPNITPQQIAQVSSRYMKEYYVTPKFDEQGNLQNLPEYYPQQSQQEDAAIRQNMEREYLAAPKKSNEQGFQFTDSQPTETGQQYRARYTDAYAKAYAAYEANGRKMPFAQWKKQFDDDFARGQYGTAAGQVNPVMNQVQTQNQTAGTYEMRQDAVGNVSIVQSDGRAYAYIPASQVPYQTAYIKQMTGKTPAVNTVKTQQ
jgi:hypothetical protein